MGQFKRARLSGSDELFRATRPEQAENEAVEREGAVDAPPTEPVADTLAVELTVPEVRAVVEALQLARFPERTRPRPTMDEFERLGELQDRLRRLVAE